MRFRLPKLTIRASWALLATLLGASWSLLSRLACSLRLSCAIPIDLGVIFYSLGQIFVNLGSILGLPEGRILRFVEGLSLQLASSLEEVTTYEKPNKTNEN